MREVISRNVISGAPARAVDLIAEFQARQDAWRAETQKLAKHREELRAAAERETAEIVAAARADVGRILVDARRRLLALTEQLGGLTDLEAFPAGMFPRDAPGAMPRSPIADHLDASDSVLKARRGLQRLLDDVRPDLVELAAQARPFAGSPKLAEPAAVPVPQPAMFSTDYVDASPYSRRGVLTVVALIASVLGAAGGIGWWLTEPADPGAVRAPVAAIPAPRAPEAALPTLTATVIPPLPARGAPTASATAAEGPSAAPPVLPPPSPLWLLIEAHRPAWIKSVTDDGAAESRLLRPGETRRLTATRKIAIVAGDAGAVAVSLNGGPATVLGRDGQVVTRNFTVDDVARAGVAR